MVVRIDHHAKTIQAQHRGHLFTLPEPKRLGIAHLSNERDDGIGLLRRGTAMRANRLAPLLLALPLAQLAAASVAAHPAGFGCLWPINNLPENPALSRYH
jgi:hypothetical protein